MVCGCFGSVSSRIPTKSAKVMKCAKVCHSVCSGVLDVAELCALDSINVLEIGIFGKPIVTEGEGFYLFSKDPDPINDIEENGKIF